MTESKINLYQDIGLGIYDIVMSISFSPPNKSTGGLHVTVLATNALVVMDVQWASTWKEESV